MMSIMNLRDVHEVKSAPIESDSRISQKTKRK